MAKISIIANFYKSEKYIPKLIESVQAQTYDDWELICVNDCSPMNDLVVLERYANKDSRIRIINNKENLGICKAKMVGIQNANGKFLTFIDGDDWLAPEALQRMIEPAEKYSLDLVVMNHYRILDFLGYKKCCRSNVDCFNEPIYYPECFDRYYMNFFGDSYFTVAYWGKLYNAKMIKESGFNPPEDYIAEDFVFNMYIFPLVKSMMFIDYNGYYWRWGGLSSGKKQNEIWNSEKMLKRSNEVYDDSLKAIEKYNYKKALIPLMKQQMRNIRGNISSIAKYELSDSRSKEVLKLIENCLKYSFYDDFKKLLQDEDYKNDLLLDAVVRKSSVDIYKQCHLIYKSNKFSRIKRSIIGGIMNLLS